MTSTATELPNVGAVLAPILARVPSDRVPLLLAIAERRAATRYRLWAEEIDEPKHRPGLLACAEREEEIARRIEALYPDAAAVQSEMLAANPDLEAVNRSLFAGRPLADQFTIQAQGERLGAATWRSLAELAPQPGGRETFLACAKLEEDSACFLEALLS